jgi:dTDP-glucose pyrophosphorylase
MDGWRNSLLNSRANIGEAIRNLEENSVKIILVVDDSGFFQGTISDGDIRRGLLSGLNLKSLIMDIIHRDALVVDPEVGRELVKQLMMVNKVRQVPVVNKMNHVVGLYLWDELTAVRSRPNIMVIMAGGMGTRLRPHTENCPKPLLPVAGKPILEHTIERAKMDGFSHFIISIHYLGHMIESYFGAGERLGVQIDYLREESPLGTAGALSLLRSSPAEPFIVTNGDVITDIQYGGLLDFHIRHDAMATMAVRLHEWQHSFGVVQTKGIEIIGLEEKPITRTHINAGIYVLNPLALGVLEDGEHCDMPSLFDRLRVNGCFTSAYPMYEPWLDVGRSDDLERANKDKQNLLKEID